MFNLLGKMSSFFLKMKNRYAKVDFDKEGAPHSILFDDKYFCQENGLAESQYIFCENNYLKERWSRLAAKVSEIFIIGETGFGSGLNFLCAWKLWDEVSPKNQILHYISIEKYPLSKKDLTQSLDVWSQLKPYAQQLINQYNPSNDSIQTLEFSNKTIRLTIIFKDILEALSDFPNVQPVDAWFLDGFAPAKNPDMWSNTVFSYMKNLSIKGTTLATFTVAGNVRRGLNNHGFKTVKIKGFGRKRHMLQGTFLG